MYLRDFVSLETGCVETLTLSISEDYSRVVPSRKTTLKIKVKLTTIV
jgi:hypothetical protein